MLSARFFYIVRYLGAFALTALTILLISITPFGVGAPFLILFAAVLVCARLFGLGPGILSGVLGAIAAAYLFLDPISSFDVQSSTDILRLATFLAVALAAAWITARSEDSRRRATGQNRQQEAVVQLGQYALGRHDLNAFFNEATRTVRASLQVEYCEILELSPDGQFLMLKAEDRWELGQAGSQVPVSKDSHAGYTLAAMQPVVVRNLQRETRFKAPQFLLDRGVVSGMSTIIEGQGRHFGILEVHSTRARKFSTDDIRFLQSVANVVALAIERMQSEAETQRQREWLQVTLSSIGDALVQTDSQGRIEFANPIFEQITGLVTEDIIGKPFASQVQMLDATSGATLPDPVATVLSQNKPTGRSNHKVLVAADGRKIPIDDTAAPIRDPRGNPVGAVLVFRDMTEQQAVERALRESEDRYRTVIETAQDAIVTIDAAGQIVLANPVVAKVFGYPAKELVGQNLALLIPEDGETADNSGIKDYLKSMEQNQSTSGINTKGRHKDGHWIPLEISIGEYLRDGQRHFTGIIRDVSERRAAEEQLQSQADMLRNVRDAVIATDTEGNITYWNDGATAIFGFSSEEMTGQKLSHLLDTKVEQTLPDGSPLSQERSVQGIELRARRKNGTDAWLDLKTAPLKSASDALTGFVTVGVDITARKRTEARVVTLNSITRVLAESETIPQATPKVLQSICGLLDWEAGVLWTVDEAADVLRCVDVWRQPDIDIHEFESLTREMLFFRGVGIPGKVWEAACPEWVEDVSLDPSMPRAKAATKNDLHGAAGFPIVTGNEFIGVIEFFSRRLRQPDREMVQVMDVLGSQIGQFIKRRRAEEALRLSQEQYAVILQGVGEGITAQDPNGRLVYANEAAARIIGYSSPQELLETPLHKVMERFEVLDEKGGILDARVFPGRIALQEKRPAEGLLRFRIRNTGDEHWSRVKAAPILDQTGQPRFAINIFHDVTEQRRSEEAVREQRELLRVTLASIGDGVISTDIRGRISFMNRVAERMTGWTLDECVGNPTEQVFKLVSEETGRAIPSAVAQVLRDHQATTLPNHTLLITRDGRRIQIDDSVAPIQDKEGNAIGVVLVFRDIAERRKAERDVSRLAAIVESSDDAILSMTLDGIVLTWNPAAERMFKYSGTEAIGNAITLTYPPDRMQEFGMIIGKLRRGEQIDHFDTVRKSKDGRLIDVSVSISLIRDSQGNVLAASKIVRDITERKRSEESARFLAEASDVLASSLEYETTLESVARLVVPKIADWCSIYVRTDEGKIRQLGLAHVDPAKVAYVQEMLQRYPPRESDQYGVYNVLQTGKSELVPEVATKAQASAARDPEHRAMLAKVGLVSYMAVPMIARGRTLGVISFVSSESGRHYGPSDLLLAQDLARRAALAMDNARLYREAQALNEELEERVVRRTIELQTTNRRLEMEISRREQMNEKLRQLSGHLQSTREEERIRIAREIHDEIGQVLTAVKMDLGLLARELSSDSSKPSHEETQQQINGTATLVDNALQTMHNIIRELRPEVLDHLGLQAALEWQIQDFENRTKIACRFSSTLDDSDLDPERSTAIFRILQETLTNVARHAEATEVAVELLRQDGELVLNVKDNGKGITESNIVNSSRFGILGMRERARALGGNVNVKGEPGTGTQVTARIPLANLYSNDPDD